MLAILLPCAEKMNAHTLTLPIFNNFFNQTIMEENVNTQKKGWSQAISSLFSFKGRAKRTEYWLVNLFSSLLLCPSMILLNESLASLYNILAMVPFIWIGLAVTVKSFHDLGKSGWYTLLLYIPIVGLLFSIYIGFFKGKEEDNQYGPNPYEQAA